MSAVQVLEAREVPLGGLRAMSVRRTLPQRERSLIGAWCFVDHYGPDEVGASGGMVVAPHPHTGLATVSWLFTGEIEHRDSAGHHAWVRPGEMNLMTAGRGISHSEYSSPTTRVLHGVQLWLALPDRGRDAEPRFDHDVPEPFDWQGAQVRVFLGELLGVGARVPTQTPLVGAELVMPAGAEIRLPVEESFEFGVLVDRGDVRAEGQQVAEHALGYLAPGTTELTLTSTTGARLLLLGGEPFGEPIVMWWNFVGRSHEEIEGYRAQWQQTVGGGAVERFSLPEHDPCPPVPAPALPHARLRPRS